MGIFEIDAFARGTMAIADALARQHGARPSSAAATRSPRSRAPGDADAVTHVSTGGGASLEFLEGQDAARRRGARA